MSWNEFDAVCEAANVAHDKKQAVREGEKTLGKRFHLTIPKQRDVAAHQLLDMGGENAQTFLVDHFTKNPADLRPNVATKLFSLLAATEQKKTFAAVVALHNFKTVIKTEEIKNVAFSTLFVMFTAIRFGAPDQRQHVIGLLQKQFGALPSEVFKSAGFFQSTNVSSSAPITPSNVRSIQLTQATPPTPGKPVMVKAPAPGKPVLAKASANKKEQEGRKQKAPSNFGEKLAMAIAQ